MKARSKSQKANAAVVKILHVADLHFRQPWFEWVATQASQFDAGCIAGDLLNMWIARDVSLRAQTKWVRLGARLGALLFQRTPLRLFG